LFPPLRSRACPRSGGKRAMAMDTGAYVAGESIYIPISGTDEAVALNVDDLPENVDDVLGLLQAELSPLGLWLDLAKAYLQRGKEEQFRAILETGCSPGAFWRDAGRVQGPPIHTTRTLLCEIW
jgi:hypothetical protein